MLDLVLRYLSALLLLIYPLFSTPCSSPVLLEELKRLDTGVQKAWFPVPFLLPLNCDHGQVLDFSGPKFPHL